MQDEDYDLVNNIKYLGDSGITPVVGNIYEMGPFWPRAYGNIEIEEWGLVKVTGIVDEKYVRVEILRDVKSRYKDGGDTCHITNLRELK